MRGRSLTAVIGVLALALLAGACGSGSEAQTTVRATPTTAPPTTTTTVFVPTAPLTGLPDPSGASQTRSALSVKIENTPEARPQSGLNVADWIFERSQDRNCRARCQAEPGTYTHPGNAG